MKKVLLILLFAGSVFAFQSCYFPHEIEGNYNLVTVTRNVSGFTGVENCGSLQVKIIRDSVAFVEIEGEENLIPYINTDVHGDILEIKIENHRNLDPNYPIIVYVHTPVLSSVEMSGSGNIQSDTLNVPQISLKISGSGDISMPVFATKVNAEIDGSGEMFLSGAATQADFEIDGSGDIHAYGMPVQECMADIAGSGSIYTTVTDVLDVVISGSGNVYYSGNPSVSVSVMGSGQVIHQ